MTMTPAVTPAVTPADDGSLDRSHAEPADRTRAIAVCDPLPLVAEGVQRASGCHVVSLEVEQISRWVQRPDCGVVVLSLVDGQRWSALSRLAAAGGALVVVALVEHPDAAQIDQAVRAGATSVCDRFAAAGQIAAVIECSRAGARVVPAIDGARPASSGWSDEEREWLRLLARGASVSDLAWKFGFSRRTMSRRLHSVYHRLGSARQPSALAEAARRGLLV